MKSTFPDDDRQELWESLTRYFAGECSATEAATLSTVLETDPTARELFVEIATQSVLLRDLTQTLPEPAVNMPLADLAAATPPENQSRPGDPYGTDADTRPATLRTAVSARWQIAIPWSVAAVFAFILFSKPFASPVVEPPSPLQAERTLGLLIDEADAQFEDGFGPDNVKFDSGEYRLAKGAIHLRMENGADILMKSPVAFRIDDAFHLTLHDGALRAIAPPAAKGLTVATPGMDYEDLGTEFGVAVNQKSGTNELHVFDGQVDARGPGSKTLIASVTQGQSVALNQGVLKPTGSPEEGRFLAPGTIGFLRWQAHCAELVKDPDLIGFYPFVEADALKNQAEHPVASDGRIQGARWTSSRWPGKSALLFDRDDDCVGLTIPGEYDEFTIAFWVNADRLDYEFNSLLNSDRFDRGSLRFLINRLGLVWTNVAGSGVSRPIFKGNPLELAKWQYVVAVVSIAERKYRTYFNGELVWIQDWQPKVRITPGDCRLGNWLADPKQQNAPNRAFKGRMDEVAIWKRALTAQEIKAHYEAGRPSLLDNK